MNSINPFLNSQCLQKRSASPRYLELGCYDLCQTASPMRCLQYFYLRCLRIQKGSYPRRNSRLVYRFGKESHGSIFSAHVNKRSASRKKEKEVLSSDSLVMYWKIQATLTVSCSLQFMPYTINTRQPNATIDHCQLSTFWCSRRHARDAGHCPSECCTPPDKHCKAYIPSQLLDFF